MSEVGLREHFEALLEQKDRRDDQRFEAQTKAIDAALASAEKAVTKAEAASEKRFESVNEFRASLNDMVRSLMPRSESDARFAALQEKLIEVTRRLDKSEGAGIGRNALWVIISGAVFLALAVGGFVFRGNV